MCLFELRVFSGYMLRSRISRSYGMQDHTIFIVFKGTSILFSIVAAPVYIPTKTVGGFPFLLTLYSIYYL